MDGLKRAPIEKFELYRLASLDAKFTYGVQTLAVQGSGSAQDQAMRSGNGNQRSVPLINPWNRKAVIKANRQVHAHADFTAVAPHHPDNPRIRFSQGHEINYGGFSGGGLKFGFQYQSVGAVMPGDARMGMRAQLPAAIFS